MKITQVKKPNRPFSQLQEDTPNGAPNVQSGAAAASTGCIAATRSSFACHLLCAAAVGLSCFLLGLAVGILAVRGPSSAPLSPSDAAKQEQFSGAATGTSSPPPAADATVNGTMSSHFSSPSLPPPPQVPAPSLPPRFPLPESPPHPSFPPPRPSSVIWFTASQRGVSANEPFNFRRCAVIGSGANLLGRQLGQAIDSHDVVVHVNNVPTRQLAADLGSRTDILFSTFCNLEARDCEEWQSDNWCVIDQEIQHGGGVTCMLNTDQCPMAAVFYRSTWATECGEMQGKAMRAASSSQYGIAVSEELVSQMVHAVRRRGGQFCGANTEQNDCNDPSTGFHAIITMALLCDEVDVYGFQGLGTVDNHGIGHNIASEHNALRHLIAKNLTEAAFTTPEMARLWARTRVSYGDN